MTQVELATLLGVEPQAISNWENDRNLPSEENIQGMMEVFSVPRETFKGRKPRRQSTGILASDTAIFQEIMRIVLEAGIPPQTADGARKLFEELRQEARTPLDRLEGVPDATQLQIRIQTLLRRYGRK